MIHVKKIKNDHSNVTQSISFTVCYASYQCKTLVVFAYSHFSFDFSLWSVMYLVYELLCLEISSGLTNRNNS